MGKYINKINAVTLPAKNKAKFILENVPGSFVLEHAPAIWVDEIVCVVENFLFDAAGYVFDESELDAFKRPTPRPITWLHVPNAKEYAK